MQVRSTLASALIAILLLLSCGASACEMNCNLATAINAAPACHGSSGAQASTATMSEQMGGMAHAQMRASLNSDQGCSSTFSACAHQACTQQPALINTADARAGSARLYAGSLSIAMAAVGAPCTLTGQSRRSRLRAITNLQFPSPVTDHTTLRV